MADIPDFTNFYCSVHTQKGPGEIARVFVPDWRVRNCSWTDYEAQSDFAEVVIESSDPVLVHGPVSNVLVNSLRIIELLAAAGLSGTFECYDESDALILEKRFGSTAGGGKSSGVMDRP
jgi:hypothetical protein